MNNALVNVEYAAASAPAFQHVVTSRFDFETTLERLKQKLAELDLWLIHEINPQMLLERGGFRIGPARQLLFFHARYVVTLLNTDPAALSDIPLKLIVLQAPDGPVSVRHADLHSLLGRYARLDELSDELAKLSRELLDGVSDGSVGATTR